MADLENSVPVTPQTLFRLASISKPITATAAMQLWEQGKLEIEAPIQKYCPAFPQKEFPISTRQLMSHLGGIRHYRPDPKDEIETNNTKHFDDPIAGGIQFFANDPLIAKPGTKFHYSTQGFTLVGCAIEGASGKKYVDYVQENIFKPAGMASTRGTIVSLSSRTVPASTRNQNPESYRILNFWTRATRFPAAAGSRPRTTWPPLKWRFSPTGL
jgi:CubicO group peptidase (beta-lactamase class C family)